MNTTLKITITKDYLLQIKTISSENKERIVKLSQDHPDDFYTPCIEFKGNFIEVCHNSESAIHFIKQWIEQPDEYSMYPVHLQNKEYQLLPEVLFSIIINEFKLKIEKEIIIEKTEIDIPIENEKVMQRINISLQAINLKGIEINEDEIEYDYKEQGDQLEEILEKLEEIDEYQRMIERAKQLTTREEEKKKLEESQRRIYSEETFNKEMVKQFTTKERSAMKLTKLDNYCVFIASRYFASLEDHVNLTKVSKKYMKNMEKFHYNPISVTEETVKMYPNVQSLHVYEENDKYFEGGRIERYVNWYKICPYYKLEEMKEEKFEEKPIEYKRIVWCITDTESEIKKNKNKVEVPEGVREMTENCFERYKFQIKEISMHSSIKNIPKNVFTRCFELTNITIPIDYSQVVCGNKIFSVPHFKEDIVLPSTVKVINGEEVDRYVFDIPSSVTSIDLNDFVKYKEYLEEITIPSTMTKLEEYLFANCVELTTINGLENVREIGRGCFFNCPNLDKTEYPRVQKNKDEYLNEIVKENYQKQLEQWTKMKCDDVIFDTSIDTWSQYSSVLNDRIKGKRQLLFMIEDEDGEVFGYYTNSKIKKNYYTPSESDNKSFQFNLESNGRIEKPMKFEIKNTTEGGIILFEKNDERLIQLGNITLNKENTKNESYCEQKEYLFDYHGVKNAVCGKTNTWENEGKDFTPKRIVVIQMEIDEEEKQMKIKERRKVFEELKQNNAKEFNQLEEWIGLKCGEVLFDSELEDWDQYTSDLNTNILGKKQIAWIIEDTKGNIFGCYIDSKVYRENDSIYDSKAFLFSLKSNGRLDGMMKFPVKDANEAFLMYSTDSHWLVSIGSDGGRGGKDDITIMKKNCQHIRQENYPGNGCVQHSYEYNGVKNALCGSDSFDIEQFFIIQMEMTEEQKQMVNQMKEQKKEKEKKQLEEWTGLKYGNIIFDSDIDDWERFSSKLNDKIRGKRQISLIIEDTEGNVFGCYVNAKIEDDEDYVIDRKAFLFSLESNGRLDGMMKFPVKYSSEAFYLYSRNNNWLVSIGSDGGRGGKDDITIMKKDCQHIRQENYPGNGCVQHSYKYNGIGNALCGSDSFDIKHFYFVQME